MALIRNAVILGVGVMLLPSDPQQQEQLYQKAASAAYWTATFCDRNEATCETASRSWDMFVAKAQFAGKLAYDAAQRYTASRKGDDVVAPAAYRAAGASASAAGTLTAEDLAPQWRGANRSGGA